MPSRRLTASLLGLTIGCAGLCSAPGSARAEGAPVGYVKVIAPGNEKLIEEMIGNQPSKPGGCELLGARIDCTFVGAEYACDGDKTKVELRHPDDAAATKTSVRTQRFAIVADGAPRGLVDELAKRVTAREAAFRWISAEAPGLGRVAPEGTAPPPAEAGKGLTPEQSEAFIAASRLLRERKFDESFEAFRKLARENPREGVLGMVVASLASSMPTAQRVQALAAEADAAPADPLAQFAAGVAAHYHGHQQGQSVEEKQGHYRAAIRFLERTRPAFDFEPRVYVYLAVSHFRLGDDAEAQALIEKAVPLATNDPDVYYCRAEIFQKADVKRSLADIDTYLEMVDKLEAQGIQQSRQKHDRVRRMRDKLSEVLAGRAQIPANDELFDPVISKDCLVGEGEAGRDNETQAPPPHRVFSSPRTFGLLALGVAICALAAWMVIGRRRPGGAAS